MRKHRLAARWHINLRPWINEKQTVARLKRAVVFTITKVYLVVVYDIITVCLQLLTADCEKYVKKSHPLWQFIAHWLTDAPVLCSQHWNRYISLAMSVVLNRITVDYSVNTNNSLLL